MYVDIDERIELVLVSYVKEVKVVMFLEVKYSFIMVEEDLKGFYGRE